MSSPFDRAWAASDAVLETVMGEDVSLGGQTFTVVVPEVEAGSALKGMVVQSGVSFMVLITQAELDRRLGAGADVQEKLKGVVCVRGAQQGRVLSVMQTSAGVELVVGPKGGR